MATVKLKSPKALTGNNQVDLAELRAHQVYLTQQLNHILNNLDEENININLQKEEDEDE